MADETPTPEVTLYDELPEEVAEAVRFLDHDATQAHGEDHVVDADSLRKLLTYLTKTAAPEAETPTYTSSTGSDAGLIRKYAVLRLNDDAGKHTECRYFVLDPQHDPIAREVLVEYANRAWANGMDELADDLYEWTEELRHG